MFRLCRMAPGKHTARAWTAGAMFDVVPGFLHGNMLLHMVNRLLLAAIWGAQTSTGGACVHPLPSATVQVTHSTNGCTMWVARQTLSTQQTIHTPAARKPPTLTLH